MIRRCGIVGIFFGLAGPLLLLLSSLWYQPPFPSSPTAIQQPTLTDRLLMGLYPILWPLDPIFVKPTVSFYIHNREKLIRDLTLSVAVNAVLFAAIGTVVGYLYVQGHRRLSR